MLEDDEAFLADAGRHLTAVRAHAERFAAESRAAIEAEARLHAVRCCPPMPRRPCALSGTAGRERLMVKRRHVPGFSQYAPS